MEHMTTNTSCRICKGKLLGKILSFGSTPLANAFLKKEQLASPEPFFPLDVYLCGGCGLVQLIDVVSPEMLFRNYVYASSTSQAFVTHFRDFANDTFLRFNLNSESLVADVGSNDGILLKPFKDLGARVLGIEPAANIAAIAEANGIETVTEFFNHGLAKKIAAEKGEARIVTATNVFAHINDLDEVVRGVKELLSEDGVFIIEAPYLADFVEKNLFDTVYHEHLSYLSVKPLSYLFRKHGMEIFDVEKTGTHGGSMRIFVKKSSGGHKIQESVKKFLEEESRLRLHSAGTYSEFSQRTQKNKEKLTELLSQIKAEGKRIAGYGAPAKGNTLLNFFGIGNDTLDYIADDSALKQGLYTPGTHIPIVAPEKLYEDVPDYVLILAWNFAEPIMDRHFRFKELGGKFIMPVPEPKII